LRSLQRIETKNRRQNGIVTSVTFFNL